MAREKSDIPDVLTLRELVQSMTDGTWNGKIDEIRSEAGGFLSLAAGAASGNMSTQITKTDVLTGKATLASAGMRFHLRDIIIKNSAAKGATVTICDGTTAASVKKMVFNLTTGSTNTVGCMVNVRGIVGRYFSNTVRVQATTGAVAVALGGIREIVLA